MKSLRKTYVRKYMKSSTFNRRKLYRYIKSLVNSIFKLLDVQISEILEFTNLNVNFQKTNERSIDM